MKKNPSLQKKFEELLSKEEAINLDLYKDTATWKVMTRNERELLGLLFVKLGEMQLKNGDDKAIDSFELAEKAAPKSPRVYYRQGIAYLQNKEQVRCMLSACRAFENACKLNDEFHDAWCAWGTALMRLGILQQDAHYFQEADLKFSEGEKFLKGVNAANASLFYLQWGASLYQMGRCSGEPSDFSLAIEKFSQAVQFGSNEATLYNYYGDALMELCFLVNKPEMLYEAGELYLRALEADANPQELGAAWHNLGCCYERLFHLHIKKEYFEIADDAFKHALDIDPKNPVTWAKWGVLYTAAGKLFRNLELIQASIEKFAKADQYEPNQPLILSRWGDSLTLYGANAERVDLIREGEEKIRKSLELDPNATSLWYLYGRCSNELGRYFGEESFYQQAIEKFQYGLSLDQNDPLLWYGLSISHFSIGELLHDPAIIEKASALFARSLEFGGHQIPSFWNDWGVALMKLAEMKNNRGYLEAAIEKFEQSLTRGEGGEDPVDPEWLYNYGCALDFLGDFTEDPAYYEKATQVLAKTLQLDPVYAHARYNFAVALSHLGEATSDVDSLQRSIDQFQILLSYDSEDEMACHDLGLAHMYMAELLFDPVCPQESQKHYEQAEGRFMQALSLGHLQSYYTLACLYALNRNFDEAMGFLEKAEAAHMLPDIEDVLNDEWLEELRETAPFKNFINQIFPSG